MTAPTRPRPRPSVIAAAVVVAIALFLAGVLVGGHPDATGLERLPAGVRSVVLGSGSGTVLADIRRELADGYYVPVAQAKLARASIDGMLASLHDPYTYYLDPAEFAAMQQQTKGLFVGVGIQVLERGRETVVAGVLPESPALRAGLAKGDVITAVDGVSTVGKTLDQVTSAIRGHAGTPVAITVRRPSGRTETVRMVRTQLHLRLVTTGMLTVGGRTVGVIRLAEFDQGAAAAVRAAAADLVARGAAGLVLDLRGDPGGLVDEAVDVVGAFAPKGSVVVTTVGLHQPRTTLKTTATPITGLPLAVLVDHYSASASEIVAGALRDDHRAVLVGQTTFGKAVVQRTVTLPDGGALHYTVARYLTPSGYDLDHKGLVPAIAVATPVTGTGDPALTRAAAATRTAP